MAYLCGLFGTIESRTVKQPEKNPAERTKTAFKTDKFCPTNGHEIRTNGQNLRQKRTKSAWDIMEIQSENKWLIYAVYWIFSNVGF